MTPPGVLVDHRLISIGDEFALLPDEFGAFANSVIKVRRASGAVRLVARELLTKLGHPEAPIPRSPSGAPIWPKGIVGSLTHDAQVAAAAIAKKRDYYGMGIDVEPTEAVDLDIYDMVVTNAERRMARDVPYYGRLLFAIKEAVYKTVYPLDGIFLEHHDVEVCLSAGSASVRNGRVVSFRYCVGSHIVVLAFVPT